MPNQVTPSQYRTVDEKTGAIKFGAYMVNEPAIPELVGRGVMPFIFLKMRADYADRFGECESSRDVNRVLSAEGHWDVRKKGDKDSYETISVHKKADTEVDKVEMSTNSVHLSHSEADIDAGETIDADWRNISDPVERRRARDRVRKREQRERQKEGG